VWDCAVMRCFRFVASQSSPSMAELTLSKSKKVRDCLLAVGCTRTMVCLLSACEKGVGMGGDGHRGKKWGESDGRPAR
jgi:hypothetical protein